MSLLRNHNRLSPGRQTGFTLIETVVYLGLFALMFGGAVSAAYNVIESTGRNHTKSILQTEGNFLLAKINWTLGGVSSAGIISPTLASPSTALQVTKYDGSSVTLSLAGQDLQIQNPSTPYLLNNSNVKIVPGSLSFTRTAATGDGINPERVDTNFNLESLTPNGMRITQNFFTSVYIRK